jgi:signal peptidase I
MRFISAIRWFLVILLVALLIAPATWTLLTHQDIVKVDGKSMQPLYEVGDVILVGPPTKADFAPGHIITVRNDDGQLYTHRVVRIENDGTAQLKGDGNAFEDPGTVSYSSVAGAVRHHINQPAAGAVLFSTTWPARISILVLLLGLTFAPLTSSPKDRTENTELDLSAEDLTLGKVAFRENEDSSRPDEELDLFLRESGYLPTPSKSAAAFNDPIPSNRRSRRRGTRYRRH